MKIDLYGGEIRLSENRPIGARRARGLRILCTGGQIWITIEGEPGDIHLSPGQTYELRGNGLALIESIGEGSIRLDTPRTFRFLERLVWPILGRSDRKEKSRLHSEPAFTGAEVALRTRP